MDTVKKDEPQDQKHDELAESLDDLFSSISTMIKSELQMATEPKMILKMDCINGAWEPAAEGRKVRFVDDIRLTLTSLEHLEQPPKVLETRLDWVQPTPTYCLHVNPIFAVHVSSGGAKAPGPIPVGSSGSIRREDC